MTAPFPARTDVGGEPPDGELVRTARLEGERSQHAFRTLLDSLSRPGTIHRVPEGVIVDGVPPALLLPLAIADVEVSVAVLRSGDHADWGRLLTDATGARLAPMEAAACVTMLVPPTAEDVERLRRGSALAPESAARLAIQVDALSDGADSIDGDAVVVELTGPGVDGAATLAISGVAAEVVIAIDQANAGYPAGLDTWFVSTAGDVAAVPRSSRLEVRERTTGTTGRD
ncbi:MAG: phosphonate C-P lyase system protein PhnH [Actinomycetota bacterium]